jgi:NAD(P)-dependent dehydrogenase (short-subunit alcohol dehydrogenase family)
MPAGGRIANIGSVVSRIHNMPGVGVYGASKAAQEYYLAVASEADVGCFQFRSRVWLLDF